MSGPWGEHRIEEGGERRFDLGALAVRVLRERGSWMLAWSHAGAPEEPIRRVATAATEGPLVLAPRTADQAVVVRPEGTLTVAAGERVKVFAVTPLWATVQTGAGLLLADLPCQRLSRTWFGPDTRDGELCLAAWRPLAVLPGASPLEAATPVLIENLSARPLAVERLRLPVPRLPLFSDAAGAFWTSRVTVRRRERRVEVEIKLDADAPAEAQRPRGVAAAREAFSENAMLNALGSALARTVFVDPEDRP